MSTAPMKPNGEGMIETMWQLADEVRSVFRVTSGPTSAEWITHLVTNLPEVLRSGSLSPADRAMAKTWYQFDTGSRRILLPREAFGLGRELIGRRVYDPDGTFDVAPGDHVLDLGANVGVFSLLTAARGAHVVAVEAQSGLVNQLTSNSRRNGLSNIVAVHGIVAAQGGLFASIAARQSASDWVIEPPELTLDDLLLQVGWSQIDLAKIDIEGSEFELVARNNAWLSKVRRVAMEVHADFGIVDDLVRTLRGKGFETRLTSLRGEPVSMIRRGQGFLFARR